VSTEGYANTFDMIITLNMKKETSSAAADGSIIHSEEEKNAVLASRPLAAAVHRRDSSDGSSSQYRGDRSGYSRGGRGGIGGMLQSRTNTAYYENDDDEMEYY
jgi:hypothetical protein